MNAMIIEEDQRTIETVSLCFELGWPEVEVFSTDGTKALTLVKENSPDVIILEVAIPDGLNILREICKNFAEIPVIILSSKGEEMDKFRGLGFGADDYIVKPFFPAELLARVKAVLRRTYMYRLDSYEEPFVGNSLTINFVTCEVLRGNGKKIPVKLTPIEYKLLCNLVKGDGKVLNYKKLLSGVWGSEYADAIEYLRKYVKRLREKLEEDPSDPRMIILERGFGYKFVDTN